VAFGEVQPEIQLPFRTTFQSALPVHESTHAVAFRTQFEGPFGGFPRMGSEAPEGACRSVAEPACACCGGDFDREVAARSALR
jgi:hypothetical protein